MAYRVNGKSYIALDQAKAAANKIFQQTGAIVAIEESKRGIFKPNDQFGLAKDIAERAPEDENLWRPDFQNK